ncbi:hypothetical protein SAMN05421678_108166 [Actinopolymorpha cephalotaxi]|uniref:Uncharacterized protein n=1 Tax=Actinopolymorpha cephalotaxi TaxID=504797 RepID=A0A1I2UMT0_9ACTN|nr:hypothetical protein [Actinopolymorpha cephalotaxi]NYH86580.1 hypothetical protein [Actinopolymorpha cephalotaxi]SFG76156.1 hypothetical protein SAMN05421678_108166 [Actinopolymorpha cephalotaxi]
MRIVTWMLMGIGAGALAGFVSALLRRRHHRVGDSVAEYAGGYAAPVASEDQTASRPVTVGASDSSNVSNFSDIASPSVAGPAAHANGAGQAHRFEPEGPAATGGRTDRAEHVGRGGRG